MKDFGIRPAMPWDYPSAVADYNGRSSELGVRRYSGVSIVRTRALTVLMSTRPAARVLMTPMTLPRSLTLVAPGGVDTFGDEGIELGFRQRLRQVGLENLELGFFLRDEIGAAAVAELRERVLALLDHALDDGLHAGIVERPARVDLALLDAGERHANDAQTRLVAASHRGLHVFR